MNRDEAERRVEEVQRIMERTTLYTLLPGTPAVIGGALALVGCVVSFILIRSLDFQEVMDLSINMQGVFGVMWTLIAIVAIAQEILWTRRAAARLGISPTARPARFAAYSFSPSVIVAMVLTWKLAADGELRYIVPVWMMCYGTGLYAAGLFSVRLPRVLGIVFIVTGAAGLLFFAEYGVVLAAASFGLLHVVFGALVMRTQKESDA